MLLLYMNIIRRVIRCAHIPLYAAKLLWETYIAWGFRRWFVFWLSRNESISLKMNDLHFLVRGSPITYKMTDTFAIMESLYHNLYNREFFNKKLTINENDTVIDIGGYIGSFAIPAAQHAKSGIVYTFEPAPENFVQLQKNIKLNGVKNIRAFNLGITAHDSNISLFMDNFNPASNNIYIKRGRAVETQALSLETVFKRHYIQKCNFLKVDCEGSEYEIIMNLKPQILKKIEKIACEYHWPSYYGVDNPQHTPQKLVAFLRKNNFYVVMKRVNPYIGMIYAIKMFKNSHAQT